MDWAVIDPLQKMSVSSQVENDVGILVPPPDMRSVVEKVARFVASVKPRLERALGRNDGMREYSFLNVADPYHAYYKHRLSEFRAQNQNGWFEDEPKGDPSIFQQMLRMSELYEESEVVNDTVVVSPITDELVTVNKLSQHMNDPKYKEQKERLFAKIRESIFVQDEEILESFISVGEKRPDIFGTTEEMVCKAVIMNINPSLILEPRLEFYLLVPEYQFLAQYSIGPVCIIVLVPQKNEMLEITVDSLSESVGSVKEQIAGEILVPASKQNLEKKWIPGHFKDNLSLAYYNVAGGDLLSVTW